MKCNYKTCESMNRTKGTICVCVDVRARTPEFCQKAVV